MKGLNNQGVSKSHYQEGQELADRKKQFVQGTKEKGEEKKKKKGLQTETHKGKPLS